MRHIILVAAPCKRKQIGEKVTENDADYFETGKTLFGVLFVCIKQSASKFLVILSACLVPCARCFLGNGAVFATNKVRQFARPPVL